METNNQSKGEEAHLTVASLTDTKNDVKLAVKEDSLHDFGNKSNVQVATRKKSKVRKLEGSKSKFEEEDCKKEQS